ncbi:MAG: DUF885 domain-containing protein [Phycisphaerales bacterium]|nr:DUF885 domain-containing protein [Phycisphaerales bacterium]
MKTALWSACAISALIVAALPSGAPAQMDEPATQRRAASVEQLIRLYNSDRGSIQRFYDMEWSEERFDRLERFYGEWQAKLAAVDAAELAGEAQVDLVLLRNEVEGAISHLELDRARLKEMEGLLPFRDAIQVLERERRQMEQVDAEGAAGVLAGIEAKVKSARERIEAGRKRKKGDDGKAARESEPEGGAEEADDGGIEVSPVLARRTAAAVRELRDTLNEWARFYEGYEPAFSWWTRRPLADANKALDEYAKYLRETIAGLKGEDEDPLVGDPIGRETLLADLKQEMIAYTPEQLIAIAEEQFAWCEAEMLRATAEMGLGDDWRGALGKVKAAHAAPGEQDNLVAEQARFAIAFVKERDLVSVPELCEETWHLRMLSPESQKTLPFAVYGGQYMGVAYAAESMGHEDKLMSMRGNNRHFSRIVTPHELIPGHHLQGYVAARSRPYRQTFSTPFLVEGWAVYWEMRLWELGYPLSPEDRIGMLFWRMHRCARIIVSLRFHLDEMTPQQMIDFLVERVGHERSGATSEVRRYIGGDYSPLYQCGYMVGALQMRALHRELVEGEDGGRGAMTDKQFNDRVLLEGPIPIELIRASLRDEQPKTEAKWMFAGERK